MAIVPFVRPTRIDFTDDELELIRYALGIASEKVMVDAIHAQDEGHRGVFERLSERVAIWTRLEHRIEDREPD